MGHAELRGRSLGNCGQASQKRNAIRAAGNGDEHPLWPPSLDRPGAAQEFVKEWFGRHLNGPAVGWRMAGDLIG